MLKRCRAVTSETAKQPDNAPLAFIDFSAPRRLLVGHFDLQGTLVPRDGVGWTTCLVLCLWALAVSARAAEPASAARPEEAGPDYSLQGEYQGMISGGFRRRPVGLQIMAQGDGAFQAVEYEGGLPGAGWDGRHRRQSQGQRRGSVAIFSGEGSSFSILNGRLSLCNEVGGLRGTLSPTQRHSPTEGLPPPPGAVVLFDGSPPYELRGARLTEDNLLMEGCITERSFNDFTMHVEFRTPFMPTKVDQGRGNSGVYIQERYELQILDSFALGGAANECGGLYKQRAPDVNMCLPPLVWQTYDIQFRAARFDAAKKKIRPAILTVRHNGVLVHNRVEIAGKTGNGKPEGPEPRPILFQNHKDPVRFRNLWILPEDRPYPNGEAIEHVRPLEVLQRSPGGGRSPVSHLALRANQQPARRAGINGS